MTTKSVIEFNSIEDLERVAYTIKGYSKVKINCKVKYSTLCIRNVDSVEICCDSIDVSMLELEDINILKLNVKKIKATTYIRLENISELHLNYKSLNTEFMAFSSVDLIKVDCKTNAHSQIGELWLEWIHKIINLDKLSLNVRICYVSECCKELCEALFNVNGTQQKISYTLLLCEDYSDKTKLRVHSTENFSLPEHCKNKLNKYSTLHVVGSLYWNDTFDFKGDLIVEDTLTVECDLTLNSVKANYVSFTGNTNITCPSIHAMNTIGVSGCITFLTMSNVTTHELLVKQVDWITAQVDDHLLPESEELITFNVNYVYTLDARLFSTYKENKYIYNVSKSDFDKTKHIVYHIDDTLRLYPVVRLQNQRSTLLVDRPEIYASSASYLSKQPCGYKDSSQQFSGNCKKKTLEIFGDFIFADIERDYFKYLRDYTKLVVHGDMRVYNDWFDIFPKIQNIEVDGNLTFKSSNLCLNSSLKSILCRRTLAFVGVENLEFNSEYLHLKACNIYFKLVTSIKASERYVLLECVNFLSENSDNSIFMSYKDEDYCNSQQEKLKGNTLDETPPENFNQTKGTNKIKVMFYNTFKS